MTNDIQNAKDRVKNLQADLKTAMLGLASGDAWQRHLDAIAAIGPLSIARLSFRNQLLVLFAAARRGLSTSCVATFKGWEAFGRYPKKGSKAVYILAPCSFKKTVEKEDGDTEERKGVFFKAMPMFLAGETEGKELPASPLKTERVQGGDERTLADFDRLAAWAVESGLVSSVRVVERGSRTENGVFFLNDRRVEVMADLSPAHRMKTLVHELTHARNHAGKCEMDRESDEVAAESAAYVVCQALGLDTSGYSFAYVALWGAEGADTDILRRRIESTGEAVAQAARTFLDVLAGRAEEKEAADLAA
jgi:hypothetical protein